MRKVETEVDSEAFKIQVKLVLTEPYQKLAYMMLTRVKKLIMDTITGLCKVRRLPFGIFVASYVFQRAIDTLLSGIPGVLSRPPVALLGSIVGWLPLSDPVKAGPRQL